MEARQFAKVFIKHLSATAVILILLGLILGCSESNASDEKPVEKTIPKSYLGIWTGEDGSTLTLRNDMSGDYKSGGKTVNGAALEVDEAAKEIRFSLMGFGAGTYKIDQAPVGNKMKLDGMEYTRSGGGSATNAANVKIPSEGELRPVVLKTLNDFQSAVEAGDFTDFHAEISKLWQEQVTAAELNEAFSPLTKRKMTILPKDAAKIAFSPKPLFEDASALRVEVGYKSVKGDDVKFRLRYVNEDGEWKLLGIRLNP